MASLLEMDIKDLFSRNKKDGSDKNPNKNSSIDRTVIIRIVIGLIAISIVASFYIFYINPSLKKQEKQIMQVEKWNKQIQSCIVEIKSLNQSIDELNKESNLKGVLFVSDNEFENFYAELTEATIRNGLRIINITRGDEIPVRLSDENQTNSSFNYEPASTSIPCEEGSKYEGMSSNSESFQPDPNCQGDECKPIAYYKMTVSYEIEGGFSNYVNFRNVLANKSKIVNIEQESITKSEGSGGLISATATVSLVKNRD